jgi:predicted N-acyltransferase
VPEESLTATIQPSTASIPAAVWNRMAPGTAGHPDNPFLEHAFFLALEESGCATRRTGWDPSHILMSNSAGEPVGLMPLFLKYHSQGEYVFDHGWANAYERAGSGASRPEPRASTSSRAATRPARLVPFTGSGTSPCATL